MPESKTAQEIRVLSGIKVQDLARVNLAEFAQRRQQQEASRLVTQAQQRFLPPLPPRPTVDQTLPAKGLPQGNPIPAAPANVPQVSIAGTVRVIVVDIDAATAEYWDISGNDGGPV